MAPKIQLETYLEAQPMWPLVPSLPLPQITVFWRLLLLTVEAGTTCLGPACVPSSDPYRLTTCSFPPHLPECPVGQAGLSWVCLDRGCVFLLLFLLFLI